MHSMLACGPELHSKEIPMFFQAFFELVMALLLRYYSWLDLYDEDYRQYP